MTTEDVLFAFTSTARPIMLKYMPFNSCVGSARATVEFFERLGIPAKAQPCKFIVECAEKKLAYTAGLSDEELSTAASVSPGLPADIPWRGHLIVIVDNKYIIDPSFDQAILMLGFIPESTIFSFPCMDRYEIDTFCDRGAVELGIALDTGERLKVKYIAVPDNNSYLESDAWNDIGIPFMVSEIALHAFPPSESFADGGVYRFKSTFVVGE